MKLPLQLGKTKRRLAAVGRKVLSLIVVGYAILLPRTAHASKTPATSSFSSRAAKVKNAIEQMTPEIKPTVGPPTVMQWGNWPNWQNWGNWANWNNWNNWPNWYNW